MAQHYPGEPRMTDHTVAREETLMIATYKATLFINHDKPQTDKLKLLPAFYD